VIWTFSDGTEVELGGVVRGTSVFAQTLRAELSDPDYPPQVQSKPIPLPGEPLDVNNAALLDCWLRHAVYPRSRGVSLAKVPDGIPPLPELTDEERGDPDVIH